MRTKFNAESQKLIVTEYAQWQGELTFAALAKKWNTTTDNIQKIIMSPQNRKYHVTV